MPKGVLQTRTSEFFGLEIAAVGPPKVTSENENMVSAKYTGSSLPEYYPGGKTITLKVTVDKKTKNFYSVQGVGEKAAKRIDTFASAILGGIDVETFRKLETAYAPPIAPTLDAETLVCDIVSLKMMRSR